MLRRALRRIESQTYAGPIETVVVFDQNIPDDSLAMESGNRKIRVIANDRKPGLAGARNSGAHAAQGKYLAFCDDDDEWLPTKLESQIAALEADPAAALSTCGILIQYGRKTTVRIPDEEQLTFRGFLRDRMTEVHPSTFVVERQVFFDDIGLVDEDIPGSYAEDYEWLLRAAKATKIVCVPAPLARIWWHKSSFFSDRWAMISSALTYLVDEYPEFHNEPVGHARILGQQAFAQAGQGNRKRALEYARDALKQNPKEKRAFVAAAVALSPVPATQMLKLAHLTGKGI